MKRILSAPLTALFCLILSIAAGALEYLDDFTDNSNDSIKTYSNLSAFDMDGTLWSALPDRTAFSFTSTASPMGWATYRVQNAESISVGFYTLEGSFYSWIDREAAWVLGLYGTNISDFNGKQLYQAGYSPSLGAIYANINGIPHTAVTNWLWVLLQEPAPAPPDALIGYGINVYTSNTGRSWNRVNLSYSSLQYKAGSPFVYEEMTGSIPSGTQFVRVELNDVQQIPAEGGGFRVKLAQNYNCLASVAIKGTNLTMGIPEPVVSEPEPIPEPEYESEEESQSTESSSTESSSSKASSSKSSSSKAASSKATAASSKAAASSASSSSSKFEAAKFEGVIELPGGSSSKTQSSQSSSPQPESESAEEALPISANAPLFDASDAPIYQIDAKSGDNKAFTAGVTVYIILVSGALAYIVLTSHSKRK